MAEAARDLDRWRLWVTAERIKERRKALGLKQSDLADRLAKRGLAVTRATISNLERGQGLDVLKVIALMEALECSLTYLVGLTNDPEEWAPSPDAMRMYFNEGMALA